MSESPISSKWTQYRSDDRELRYFSCDLSKYIGTKLPRTFTSGNIDIGQFKREYKRGRLIEYKHKYEAPPKWTQLELYKQLGKSLQYDPEYTWAIYHIESEPPLFDKLYVRNLLTGNYKILTSKEEINQFLMLEFEI